MIFDENDVRVRISIYLYLALDNLHVFVVVIELLYRELVVILSICMDRHVSTRTIPQTLCHYSVEYWKT